MNKKAKISAIERDERSIALPIRIPLAKALVGLKSSILEAIASGDFSLIETFCQEKLLPLLEVQSELAYLKGGRRAELSARKVVNESALEFAPVKLSLGDDGDERARGVIEYLRRISSLDPSKAKTKFDKHIAGAIGDLSKEITSEVKKAVEDLTLKNVHLRGGKAKILQTLLENGVQVTNTPALAETLFRTQSQQAYSAGRWNTSMDSDIGDYIWGFEYVTAGDDRVREGHRVLEGVRLPKEDPFWKKYFPPNGWNCRCTTLEIWKDEPTAKIDFGITGRDPRKRTPGAMNVPSEFRGNVGIFAVPKKRAAKNEPKEKVPTFKNSMHELWYRLLVELEKRRKKEEARQISVSFRDDGVRLYEDGKLLYFAYIYNQFERLRCTGFKGDPISDISDFVNWLKSKVSPWDDVNFQVNSSSKSRIQSIIKNDGVAPEKQKREVREAGTFKVGKFEFKIRHAIEFRSIYNAIKKHSRKEGKIRAVVEGTRNSVRVDFRCDRRLRLQFSFNRDLNTWIDPRGKEYGDAGNVVDYVIDRAIDAGIVPDFHFDSYQMLPGAFEAECALKEMLLQYREPPAQFEITYDGLSGDSLREKLNQVLAETPPARIRKQKISADTATLEIARDFGIVADLKSQDSLLCTLQALQRIREFEGEPKFVRVVEVANLGAYMAMSQDGQFKMRKKLNILALQRDAQEQFQSGFWSSPYALQSWFHEDTHAQLNRIEDILGKDKVGDRLQQFVDEIGGGKFTAEKYRIYKYSSNETRRDEALKFAAVAKDKMSVYGGIISSTGSYYHEMVAEARGEVLASGNESRDFSRRVYAVYLELLREANEQERAK